MSTHAFSNGTSAQLTVVLDNQFHAYVGGSLRLVASKEEVALFLSDLQSWAGRVFPAESQGTNGAPEMSTPEPEAVVIVPNLTDAAPLPGDDDLPSPRDVCPEVVRDLAESLELVLSSFVENKPTVAELSRAVDGVSRELFAQAVDQAGSMVPEELKPVFDLVRSL